MDHIRVAPEDRREELYNAFATSLVECPESTAVATAILAEPDSFVANDGAFLYPPCIDAIGTGEVIRRCGSSPTLAVLVARDPCDASLARAARIAAESNARPWQMGAIAVYSRCGQTEPLRALLERLRSTPPYNEDSIRRALDHTFPREVHDEP